MNKNAIKKFAIEARKKLIASVSDRAGMLGITPEGCSEPISKGIDFEVYKTVAGTEVTLGRIQCEQRRKLKEQIEERGFEAVVEEVAYTWFNRICAIRFMEVNDYLPTRVRVLSSEKEGKNEPDIVTQAPDVDLDFTDKEREYIFDCKINNKLDELFKMLFIKQCNKLSEILPELFEATEDYTEMLLNISYTNKDDIINMLVNQEMGIPEADFNVSMIGKDGQPTGQVEIIGWLYQYYNTELKDDTFAQLKKNVKISKERIPAATQIFTPDWIVRYMVENSIGRIWINHLKKENSNCSEAELLKRFDWKYYVQESANSESEKGINDDISINNPQDIKCIDPCMGSGHILVAMFDVLLDIYKSVGYSERDAAFEIVENNINGLDIDKRAYQLAYFAIMMKGRGVNRRFLQGRDGVVIKPHVHVITESNGVNRKQLGYFGCEFEELKRENIKRVLGEILDSMRDAREYGSILKVPQYEWESVDRFIEAYSIGDQMTFEMIGIDTTQETLKRIVDSYKLLAKRYTVAVTNPPYMGSSGMDNLLSDYIKVNYPDSKNDFFAVFIERCKEYTECNGYYAMITQPSFLFLSSYEKLRRKILENDTIDSLVHMGRGIFGIDFGSTAFVIKNARSANHCAKYFKLYERTFQYIEPDDIRDLFLNANRDIEYSYDFSKYSTIEDGEESFISKETVLCFKKRQKDFEKIPGLPIAYWAEQGILNAFETGTPLGKLTVCRNGMKTGDNSRFLRNWWEIEFPRFMYNAHDAVEAIESGKKWFPYNKGGDARKWYGNNEYVVNWENEGYEIFSCAKQDKRNVQDYPKEMKFVPSGTWSLISAGKPTFRYKEYNISDIAGMSFYNGNEKTKYYLGFCNSNIASEILQMLAPTINYQAGDIGRLPILFDVTYEEEVTRLVEECINLAKQDWDDYETSWDFIEHPFMRSQKTGLISECYMQWQKEVECRAAEMLEKERRINEIFCEIYDLDKQKYGEVTQKDIILSSIDSEQAVKSFLSYLVGCILGRYSLSGQGINYAGGELLDEKIENIMDKDNVLPVTDEEYFEGDLVGLVLGLIRQIFGEDSFEENISFVARQLGTKGKSDKEIIRSYFLGDFIKEHIKTYQKRPIYWMFDSGKENGFKCLTYLHRYDVDTIGRIRIDYLHETQKAIEQALISAEYVRDNTSNGTEKSNATKKIAKYTKQLAEIKLYDEAMAHMANRRISIRLDDGVKVNYEKFQGVEVAQEGKKALKIDLLEKIQ